MLCFLGPLCGCAPRFSGSQRMHEPARISTRSEEKMALESFWPPSYRACYDLHWIVENGGVVGLKFTELDRGSVFVGRYR